MQQLLEHYFESNSNINLRSVASQALGDTLPMSAEILGKVFVQDLSVQGMSVYGLLVCLSARVRKPFPSLLFEQSLREVFWAVLFSLFKCLRIVILASFLSEFRHDSLDRPLTTLTDSFKRHCKTSEFVPGEVPTCRI